MSTKQYEVIIKKMSKNRDDMFDRYLANAMEVALIKKDMQTLYKLESIFSSKFLSYLKDNATNHHVR